VPCTEPALRRIGDCEWSTALAIGACESFFMADFKVLQISNMRLSAYLQSILRSFGNLKLIADFVLNPGCR
jgi:hypothetical protein